MEQQFQLMCKDVSFEGWQILQLLKIKYARSKYTKSGHVRVARASNGEILDALLRRCGPDAKLNMPWNE